MDFVSYDLGDNISVLGKFVYLTAGIVGVIKVIIGVLSYGWLNHSNFIKDVNQIRLDNARVQKLIEQEVEFIVFKNATKKSFTPKEIDVVYFIQDKTGGEFSLRQLGSLYYFYDFSSAEVVKIKLFDSIFNIFNWVMVFFVVVYSGLLLYLAFFKYSRTDIFFIVLGFGLGSLLLSIMFLMDIKKYYLARKLKKRLLD